MIHHSRTSLRRHFAVHRIAWAPVSIPSLIYERRLLSIRQVSHLQRASPGLLAGADRLFAHLTSQSRQTGPRHGKAGISYFALVAIAATVGTGMYDFEDLFILQTPLTSGGHIS